MRALLLDIEGTTSSLEFVHDVLFPYAREHLAAFIAERRGDAEVDALLAETERLLRAEGTSEAAPVPALERWMAEDRKATPLKALQGLLWEAAFRRGAFVAHVYPDVAPALRLFRERGLQLYVYSSGSVRAQRAFFRHSAAGDLTGLIDGCSIHAPAASLNRHPIGPSPMRSGWRRASWRFSPTAGRSSMPRAAQGS